MSGDLARRYSEVKHLRKLVADLELRLLQRRRGPEDEVEVQVVSREPDAPTGATNE
jgi:hypothetical protein